MRILRPCLVAGLLLATAPVPAPLSPATPGPTNPMVPDPGPVPPGARDPLGVPRGETGPPIRNPDPGILAPMPQPGSTPPPR